MFHIIYLLPHPCPIGDFPCITYTPVPLLWRSWRKGVFSAALTLTLAASKALFKEVGGFSSSGSLFFIIISKEFICNILETKKKQVFVLCRRAFCGSACNFFSCLDKTKKISLKMSL